MKQSFAISLLASAVLGLQLNQDSGFTPLDNNDFIPVLQNNDSNVRFEIPSKKKLFNNLAQADVS
jgi:hypothetical protein